MVQLVDSIAERNEGLVLLLGRLGIGVLYLPSGFNKMSDSARFAGYLAAHGVPEPVIFWVWIAALIEFFGALAIILGFQTRVAAIVLCLFTIVAAFIGHPYWTIGEAAARMQQYVHFWKDIAIAGGLLCLFARGAGALSFERS